MTTPASHRTIDAARWVEACGYCKVAREDCDLLIASAPQSFMRNGLVALASRLHRIEQILLTSDPVSAPHHGDDFEPGKETLRHALTRFAERMQSQTVEPDAAINEFVDEHFWELVEPSAPHLGDDFEAEETTRCVRGMENMR